MVQGELQVWQNFEGIDEHANVQILSNFGTAVVFFEDAVDGALYGNTMSPCHRSNIAEEYGRTSCSRCRKPVAGRFWINGEDELDWDRLYRALVEQASQELSPLQATLAVNELVRHLHSILEDRDGQPRRNGWRTFAATDLHRLAEVTPWP